MVMLRWQIQTKALTLSTRRIKQVLFLAAQNSIHWLSVTWWHWGRGAQPIFSPHISVTILCCLLLWTLTWGRSPRVHVSPVWPPERNWEPGERLMTAGAPDPVVTPASASHPALVTGSLSIFAELTTFLNHFNQRVKNLINASFKFRSEKK